MKAALINARTHEPLATTLELAVTRRPGAAACSAAMRSTIPRRSFSHRAPRSIPRS